LDVLPQLLKGCSVEDQYLMARLRDLWAHIDRDVTDIVSVVTEAQWASPPGYRSALQLARLILIGAAVDPATGTGGQAFTLSLAAVWERSLRKMFAELGKETGWSTLPSADRTRRWDDAVRKGDKNRWMTADILAESGPDRWVLDAKYKCEFGDESRNDRFQMCAYAIGFNAARATLVYPTADQQGFDTRLLLRTTYGSQPVRVDSIELPMAAGPIACRAAILAACNKNRLCEGAPD